MATDIYISHAIDTLVRAALDEDIGRGDVTTESVVPPKLLCRVHVVAKQSGVVSGIDVFRHVFEVLEAQATKWSSLENSAVFAAGDEIASFEGNAQRVLMGERVALNFLQRLCGIATLTARYVNAVQGTDARVVDTRKTTPMLRGLEKRAVVHGGGVNHRFALYDGILIKENHIAAAGGIENAIDLARRNAHHLLNIEVEVRNLEEFDCAMKAGADAILLDNMRLKDMREAVRRSKERDVVLEASGNVTLDTIRDIAETGVHLISVGALTHSASSVDLSMLIAHA